MLLFQCAAAAGFNLCLLNDIFLRTKVFVFYANDVYIRQ